MSKRWAKMEFDKDGDGIRLTIYFKNIRDMAKFGLKVVNHPPKGVVKTKR